MKFSSFTIAFLIFILVIRYDVEGQSVDSIKYENGFLYYHIYGSGKPIILLSGGPGNRCQQIEDVAINLGKQYQVILLEQRGTGISIPTPMDSTTINLKALLSDINILLDHLKLKDAIFLGHSWGGTLAMSYAAFYPRRVQSLILVGPGFFSADKVRRQTFELNGRVRLGENDLKRFDFLVEKQKKSKLTADEIEEFRKITYKSYVYDKFNMDYLFEKIKTGTRNTLMNTLIWADLDRIEFDISKQLQAFKKPVSIISGLQDPLAFVSYELKTLLPNSNLYWIQSCGHYPMYEQTEIFYDHLSKALNKP